ncbi:hypothetical protein B9S64_07965 [Streptomyces sp. SM18]|nr:hypothetical protein B9S64_07965 [Streptomyces sp. SM18]
MGDLQSGARDRCVPQVRGGTSRMRAPGDGCGTGDTVSAARGCRVWGEPDTYTGSPVGSADQLWERSRA